MFSFFDRTLTPAARQLERLENEHEDDAPNVEEVEVEVPGPGESDCDQDEASETQDPEEEHEDEEGSQNELYFMMLLQMCLGLNTQILVYIFLTRRVVWA